MVRGNGEFTTIAIKKKDLRKLENYKIHQNQPIWEIIEKILDGKEDVKKC